MDRQERPTSPQSQRSYHPSPKMNYTSDIGERAQHPSLAMSPKGSKPTSIGFQGVDPLAVGKTYVRSQMNTAKGRVSNPNRGMMTK